MFQVTKETNIGEILQNAVETVPFFVDMGMHCLGCPASQGESLEDAAAVHGMDINDLMGKIAALG